MCDNTEQAINQLREVLHAAGYNYSLLDRIRHLLFLETMERSNIFSADRRIHTLAKLSEGNTENIHQWFSDKHSPVSFTSDYARFLEHYIQFRIFLQAL